MAFVLYGCATWSLSWREEHRPRACESRVLREVFGPERDRVMGDWGKLRNEQHRDL